MKKDAKNEIIFYALLGVLTLAGGLAYFGRGFDFGVCSSLRSDAFACQAFVKGIQENGLMGSLFNPRLGAPETAVLLDYPFMGTMASILCWIISLFMRNAEPFTIVYVYFLLTFFLDGACMALLLRKLNVNRPVAFVVSALFAFAPHHFFRNLGHLALVDYSQIPLAILLSLYITGAVKEKKWKIALYAVLVGLGYGYYYAFGLILMAVALIIKFIKLEKKRDIWRDLWVIGVVLATVFLCLSPSIIYSLLHGSNTSLRRHWENQESYGLKIINLLLPVAYSRISALKALTSEYLSKSPLVTEIYTASLGIVGSVGFLCLCVAFFISIFGRRDRRDKQWDVIDFLFVSTLVIVLFATIGGFGEIFNWFVTSQIRCQNRASIVIAALSLTMVALLLDRVQAKGKWLSLGICAVVLCGGMYDQMQIKPENWQAPWKQQQEVYEKYFAQVEASLPENAMVYQLPYMRYPEASRINDMDNYEPFLGYMFTDTLRWSYGGMMVRNRAAADLNVDSGMSYAFLYGIDQAGFQAVYIDTYGYEDRGEEILAFYDGLGLTPPMVSEDGRIYIYDISGLDTSKYMILSTIPLVKDLANSFGVDVSEDEVADLAAGMFRKEKSACETIFSWLMNDGVVTRGSNEEYVSFLYAELLDRDVDEVGATPWIQMLADGVDRESVFENILYSDEFQAKCFQSLRYFSLITNLAAFFDVDLSEDEAVDLTEGLIMEDADVYETIFSWFLTDDIVTDGSNEEYVSFLYSKLLGRPASEGEIDGWGAALDEGTDRKTFFESFFYSGEFRAYHGLPK